MSEPVQLTCDCCGCVGAESDTDGRFFDGQPLVCGCSGHVSLDAESPPRVHNTDEPCKPWADCWTTEERRHFWEAAQETIERLGGRRL